MSMRCATCSLTLNSTVQYEQHMNGKSHAKKMKKLAEEGQGSTAVGMKQINFVPAESGQPGLVSPPGAEAQSLVSQSSGTKPASANGSELDKYCELCMVNLNSLEQAQIHYSGTKHLRKVKLARQYYKEGEDSATGNGAKNGTFFCGFCNITVNSAMQMSLHREGSKHRRMVEGMKRHTSSVDNGPAAKRPAPTPTPAPADPTNTVPHVSPSQIVPFDQMLPGSS